MDWMKHLAISWNWKMVEKDTVEIGPYVLELTPYYFELVWREWRSWKNWYLPSWSLKGKTILDVGAGCGETALFYYYHGAKKVIAIEPQSSLVSVLRRNKARNKWDMQVVEGPFEKTMLEWNFDFMKMDGEGCEALLLDASFLPPCAIEVHSRVFVEGLRGRFGLEVLPQKDNWILQNFAQGPTNRTTESEEVGRNA
jgi:SAM-dependent methyltransferase